MKCERAPVVPEEPIAGLEVEVAKPEDAAEILALYLACGFEPRSEERMRAALSDGRQAHAVARAGGALAAFVELETHWPKRPWSLRGRQQGAARPWSAPRSSRAAAHQLPPARRRALLALPANCTALRVREGRLPPPPIDALEKKL
jgi:hypothetical protein